MAEKVRRYKVVAEVGSALAVVLSLVFVGLEVRGTSRQTALNTESLQVAAYQDLIAQIGQFNQLMARALPRLADETASRARIGHNHSTRKVDILKWAT